MDRPAVTGLRLETAEEVAARALFEPDNAAELLYPPASRHRWHCSTCGRFVRQATVRKLPPWPGEADEHEYQGDCPKHGRVDVVWPEV